MLRKYCRYSATHGQPDAIRDSIVRLDRADASRTASRADSAAATNQHTLRYTCPADGHARNSSHGYTESPGDADPVGNTNSSYSDRPANRDS